MIQNAQVVTAPRITLATQVENIADVAKGLHAHISNFTEALNPVLGPDYPDAQTPAVPPPSMSPLCSRLREVEDVLLHLRERIQRLQERLTIS